MVGCDAGVAASHLSAERAAVAAVLVVREHVLPGGFGADGSPAGEAQGQAAGGRPDAGSVRATPVRLRPGLGARGGHRAAQEADAGLRTAARHQRAPGVHRLAPRDPGPPGSARATRHQADHQRHAGKLI